jgi:hypothetical protein
MIMYQAMSEYSRLIQDDIKTYSGKIVIGLIIFGLINGMVGEGKVGWPVFSLRGC